MNMNMRAKKPRKEGTATPFPAVQDDTQQRGSAIPQHAVDEVPPIVQEVISSSGQSLDTDTQTFMEARFGHDFSQVRVHTDERAVESAQAMDALAYTVGRDVVFGEEQYEPETREGKGVLAHELTHVVQQNSYSSKHASNHSENADRDNLELQAQTAAHNVVTFGQVDGQLSHTAPGLFFLRQLGSHVYKDPFGDVRGKVEVRSRTVEEWQIFLSNQADTRRGSIELNAFMAQALNQPRALGGYFMEESFTGTPPKTEEAVDLMIAFLTVGRGIDLPNRAWEGETRAQYVMANLLADFNAKFTDLALRRMSKGKEFGRADVENIAAYAGEAASMKQGPPIATKDPVASFLAASIAAAFAAAVEIINADTMAGQDAFKREKFLLLRNSVRTMRGALDHIEDITNEKVMTMNAVFNAAAAATGKAPVWGQIVAWGLAGAASTFFQNLLTGSVKDKVRDFKDEFNTKMNKVGEERNVKAETIELIKHAFEIILNY